MRITLFISNNLSAQSEARSLTLERDPLLIGRERSDVTIMDERCSRNHLALFADKQGCVWAKDLGSKNGTYLNDRRIDTCAVKPGDILRVGTTEIEVVEFVRTERQASKPDDSDRGSPEIDVEHTETAYSVIASWPDENTSLPPEKRKAFDDRIPTDVKRKHR